MLADTMPRCIEADKIATSAKAAKRSLTSEESAFLAAVAQAVDACIQVDSFPRLGAEADAEAGVVRPGLRGTKFEQMEMQMQMQAVAVPV